MTVHHGDNFVMGIYPMLLDETCFFLAADFDKSSWQEDAVAFLKICNQMNLSVALERSRSGKGGHVWLFFKEAISAGLARRLGAHILTETMEKNPDLGLDSYDRFFPNQDTLPIIGCAHDYTSHIGLPRGCFDDIEKLFDDLKIKIRDELFNGEPLFINFCGQLRQEQEKAAEAMLQYDIGVLSATTAFGKTVIAAWLIAKRQVNTLVIVHRKQLQDQWIDRLATFLDIPKKSIGRIGGGKRKPTGIIDIATIQSLYRKKVVDDCVAQYGHIIVDECHHLPVESFEDVVRQVKGKFITGLSATVVRKDGRHPIIMMRCGPIRYRVNAKEQAITRPFDHFVFVCSTAFFPEKRTSENLRIQFQDLNAYRRDRRKDILLQENGYMVLRFLAEDIGKYLDNILDSIFRSLSTRKCSKLGFKCNS